jgi:peptidoglycan/LPS O-acetylase OafA/YrhL
VRATAIALVLVAHASFEFLPLTHRLEAVWMLGHLGVELFFVLSGFLIGGILARQAEDARLDVGRFWVRRWLRTLPNYYLFLLVNIALARWTEGSWPDAGRYFVFLQNFAWPQPLFFIESWSLAVEEIFYLVAPLLVLFAGRATRGRGNAVALVALAIAAATSVRIAYVVLRDPNWDLSLRMVSVVRMDAIAYGVLAMLLCRAPRTFAARHASSLAMFGTLGTVLAVALYLAIDKDTSLFARTGLFSLISLSFAAFLPAAAGWVRSGEAGIVERGVRALARWSYALYLCQLAVMRAMNALLGDGAPSLAACAARALLFVAMSVACAAFVYRWFEAPVLRWRDRITAEAQPAAGSAAGSS